MLFICSTCPLVYNLCVASSLGEDAVNPCDLDPGGHNNPNKKTPRGRQISKGIEQKLKGQFTSPTHGQCLSNGKYSVFIFKTKGDNSFIASLGITDENKSITKT